jgi:hypothetical protein
MSLPNNPSNAISDGPVNNVQEITMGCAPSKADDGERKAVAQNAKIDRLLRQDRKEEARTVKILLLGE